MSVSQPPDSIEPDQPAPPAIQAKPLPPEQTLWEGTPSQYLNFWTFLICGLLCILIFPPFVALWEYIKLRSVKYEVTTQRIRMRRGIFSRTMDDVELYRLRDYHLEQSFTHRLFGIWNIVMTTVDKTHPKIVLEGIRNGEKLRDDIRNSVEAVRLAKGVREVDLA
ncbi:PH domain-containing protein [Candidatus Sumerlaeota bacterium]|nr:PH domain-containing protein [Candidatus Sumerlaeota bacterium]